MGNIEKIDIVVTWVDGADEKWRQERDAYREPEDSNGENRYRDWGLMRYWFRGIEKFAPWVNKVYFVTWGHIPEWLNTKNRKLVIVNHEDYIPKKYLPTFSGHPIELNLHRIEGLSERFIYFNDDMFLTGMTEPEFFFENGLPKDTCVESTVMQGDYNDMFAHILVNTCSVINMHYDKKQVIKTHRKKWFSKVYGKDVVRNYLLYPFRQFSSFKFYHLPNSFLKSSFEAVWDMEGDLLDQVCRNKFRTIRDINQYVFRYYQLVNGIFSPRSPHYGRFFMPERDDLEEICQSIENSKYKMICVNDDVEEERLDEVIHRLQQSFEILLPDKCSFEK